MKSTFGIDPPFERNLSQPFRLSAPNTDATRALPWAVKSQSVGLKTIRFNPYAQELAQLVIWIGYLQWKHDNGYDFNRDPILDNIESIHRTDAILDLSDPKNPKEPEWPAAEFIIGNPPFLGGKLIMFDRPHVRLH